jgi:NAD(P)-dependent dehydrogenase (short-subunit alcohol dehydrogenase family)
MGLLDGKVAIVTGAGGGLGEAYARLFAREGAAVVINDLGGARDGTGTDRSAAQKVVDAIEAEGGRAVANGDDVSTVQGGENILQAALDNFGKVDVLVCNAGILRDKTFANTSEADWDAVVKVHLKGTYCCALPVWRWMKDNGTGGVMVLTSSTSGLYGNFGQANYGAAKAGIYGLMRVLAIEGRKYDIRVWGLAPGAYTRMTADLPGRKGREPEPTSLPEHIAPAVLYMVSDLSKPHTGKVLGASGRGVREIKMLQTDGFKPELGWSAHDLARHADEVFFPDKEMTAASA